MKGLLGSNELKVAICDECHYWNITNPWCL